MLANTIEGAVSGSLKKLLFFLFISTALTATTSIKDELVSVENLVRVTEHNLQNQRRLLALIEKYREAEDLLLLEEDSAAAVRQTARLVALAVEMREEITKQGLEDYFSSQFLTELTKVSSLGGQRKVARR